MRQRCEQGMTLMELLVAMVIGSLVITLVIRGLGMSLNLYERVSDMTATMDITFRESYWWTDSVASLIPCTDAAHCVEGDANGFRGVHVWQRGTHSRNEDAGSLGHCPAEWRG